MDSMATINTDVVESEELVLPHNHPGRDDEAYVRRRTWFFHHARELRRADRASPQIEYDALERRVWRDTFSELSELHERSAAEVFLQGKKQLGLQAGEVPQLRSLEALLEPRTGVRLLPAEGLLHGKIYFNYWSRRCMPCTQFLRHPREPQYTPEPDIIHDVIGHVPPLMDQEYVTLIQRIGAAAQHATSEALERIVRFYWFSVEFGLLEERGALKILGAGILSSIGEMKHVLSGGAELRAFDYDAIMEQPFDTTHLQPVLYVAPSMEVLREHAGRLVSDAG